MGVLGLALGAGTAMLDRATQDKREARSYENQKNLMNLQSRNQMELNKQGQQLQMDMWNKTNYGAQMEHLKSAGLNPALLYGMSGGGGVTTGSQGGGSASSGSAPQPQQMRVEQIMQSALMEEQLGLMKAQKEKTTAEAESIRGEEGTIGASQIEKLIQETKHEAVKETLTQAQKYTEEMKYTTEMQESMIKGIEHAILRGSWQDQIKQIKAEAVNTMIEAEVKKSGINLTEQQTEKARQEIIQRWAELGVKGVQTILQNVIKTR